jgi:hypothetical protein
MFATKMTSPSPEVYSWPRRSESLPRASDFDHTGCDLDGQEAIRIFCGMPLEQAYNVFMEHPEIHIENFMHMGAKAFAYYFPVIDRYLRETRSNCKLADCNTDILASVIEIRLDDITLTRSAELLLEIRSLTDFVQAYSSRFSGSKITRKRIRDKWARIAVKLAQCEQAVTPNA